jgi:hypothetical protein
MIRLLCVLTLLLSGCAGTSLGQKAAKFTHEYCDAPLGARQIARAEANTALELEASKASPPRTPDYICFDCGNTTGDECTDRSKPEPSQ